MRHLISIQIKLSDDSMQRAREKLSMRWNYEQARLIKHVAFGMRCTHIQQMQKNENDLPIGEM
jgi:hypothetical protein